MRVLNSNLVIALLGGSVLAGLVIWALFWRVEEVEIVETEEKPPVVSRSVDLIGRQNGQERWRLRSEEVRLLNGQQHFDQGAHGLFYGNVANSEDDPFFENQDQMEWQAGQARYDANSEQLVLKEDVEVRDPDGSQLLTSELWVTPEQLMDVPTPFTLASDDMVLSGQTGSFNFQFALMIASEGKLVALPEPKIKTVPQAGLFDAAYAAGIVDQAEADPDSTTITADNLTYDRNTKIARGEGNLVIAERGVNIEAPQGNFDRTLGLSSLTGGVILTELAGGSEGTLLADLSLPQTNPEDSPSREEQPVTITADRLDYDRDNQIAQGEGSLELQQGDTIIEAPRGTYRRRESQSILVEGVTLREPSRTLSSDRLEGNHKDKVFLFEDDVSFSQLPEPDDESQSTIEVQSLRLVYDSQAEVSEFTDQVRFIQTPQSTSSTEAGQPLASQIRQQRTEVTAARLIHNSQTETSEFSENVELIQEDRVAKADQVRITPQTIFLVGNVEIQQIDGDAFAQEFEDPDVQQDIARPTLVFADRVEIDQATNDAQFFDNVVIVQSNRAAEGDTATYLDEQQIFKLSATTSAPVLLCDRENDIEGAVPNSIEGLPGRNALDVMCRGADKISSQLITLDMENDKYEASENARLEFKVSNDEVVP